MALSRRQKLTIGALILYWLVLFTLAHVPIPQLVFRAHVSDKSLHFTAYLILAFLFWFAINPERKVNWLRASAWWVLLVLAGYGIADEVLQDLSGRSCDIMDYVADLIGAITGLILFSFFSFWLALLITTSVAIFALTNVARANLADLIPVTNAMFNFLAYGFFTVVWIQCIYLFLSPKAPPLLASARKQWGWLITALALPMLFLLAVRVFSAILGKEFVVQDVVLSIAGIVTAVFLAYLLTLFRRTNA